MRISEVKDKFNNRIAYALLTKSPAELATIHTATPNFGPALSPGELDIVRAIRASTPALDPAAAAAPAAAAGAGAGAAAPPAVPPVTYTPEQVVGFVKNYATTNVPAYGAAVFTYQANQETHDEVAAAAKAVADAAAAAAATAAADAAAAAAAAREATTAENAAADILTKTGTRLNPTDLGIQMDRLRMSSDELERAKRLPHTELERKAHAELQAAITAGTPPLVGNFYVVALAAKAESLLKEKNLEALEKVSADIDANDRIYDEASGVLLDLPSPDKPRSWRQFRSDLFITIPFLGIPIPLPLPLLWKALKDAYAGGGPTGVLKLIVFKILPIALVIGGAIAAAILFPPILAPFAAGLAWSVGLFSAVTLPPLAITVISTAMLMLLGLTVVSLPAIISGFRSLVSYFTGKKLEALPDNVKTMAEKSHFSADRLANALNQATVALENSKQRLGGKEEAAKLEGIIRGLKESLSVKELNGAVDKYVAWHNATSGAKVGGTRAPMHASHFMTKGKPVPFPITHPAPPSTPGISGLRTSAAPPAARDDFGFAAGPAPRSGRPPSPRAVL